MEWHNVLVLPYAGYIRLNEFLKAKIHNYSSQYLQSGINIQSILVCKNHKIISHLRI